MAQISCLAVTISSSTCGRPCPPLVPAAVPRVLSYSTTSRRRPPFAGLTMHKKQQSRLCFLQPHCAADDQTCPDDDDDPAVQAAVCSSLMCPPVCMHILQIKDFFLFGF